MTIITATGGVLPPFCTLGPDLLPQGPTPGTPESEALAAWEVLTCARVARSTGSGRMSLLGKYEREGVELSKERLLWIALHAFEGASERWACRAARSAAMSDAELLRAIVQEMGGPADEPDEMTTLGFWLGRVGFYFDSRGPCLEILRLDDARAACTSRFRRQRIGRGALVSAARRILAVPRAQGGSRGWRTGVSGVPHAPSDGGESPLQLTLL